MGRTELTILQKMKALFFMFMLLSISLLIIYLCYLEEQSHAFANRNVMERIKSNFEVFAKKNDEESIETEVVKNIEDLTSKDYYSEEFQSSYFDADIENDGIVLQELSTNPLSEYPVEKFYIRSLDLEGDDISGSYHWEEIDNNSLYIQY